jgi:cobalt-zinc-cadmium efflux system membrane fusion protein
MTTVHRYFSMILFLAVPVLWTSCSSESGKKDQQTEIQATPPSVSGETGGKLFVRLTDKERDELKIETVKVIRNIQNYSLQIPGVVFPAQDHISIISTPVDGQIRAILVREGQQVQKGQEIFKIESLVYGNLVAEYLQAIAEEKFQTSRLERIKQLVEETISSSSELERAASDYQRAMAVSISAYAKLKAIGVPDHEIELFKQAEKIDPSLKIHAPISGSFDQRKVELGQSVNALEELGRVIDLRRVLIRGYLSPEDAQYVNPGDSVKIGRREDEKLVVMSVIASVNPGLDEDNRSVVVNAEVEARNNWPKPGENVRVEIFTRSAAKVFAVPLKALTYDGNDAVVFVKKDENTYEKRLINVSEIRGQNAIIRDGISENEELAVSQVFSLKALSRYEQIAEE